MDFVFLDLLPGHSVLGTGPFTFLSERPDDGSVAFYMQDFAMGREDVWAIPAEWHRLDEPLREVGARIPSPSREAVWQDPDRGGFARVFGDISGRIAEGELRKVVPAVVERIALNGTSAGETPSSFPKFETDRHGAVYRFGYRFGKKGAIGVTPEVLLSLDGSQLQTMALAGTASLAGATAFDADSKQIREHQLVVDALVESLRPHGSVHVGEREVVEFAKLLHFRTLISVDLNIGRADPAKLVEAIHPTPAVGVLPRTSRNLAVLDGYRRELGVPDAFGAPLGVWCEGTFHAVATIRGFFFDGTRGCLPAGCGIIAESIEEKEWDELKLKRTWVKQRIGLA